MRIQELIQLRGSPFPKSLPVPAEELLAFFSRHGITFVKKGGVIRFQAEYDFKRFSAVKLLVAELGLKLEVRHSIWPEFEEKDYKMSPLWLLLFPDIYIREIDFSSKCGSCGRGRIEVDVNFHPDRVDSDRPIISVNGQFTIVRSDVAVRLREALSGVKVHPFDKGGAYCYLLAEHRLRNLIIHPDDVLNLQGTCSECLLPRFEIMFGPLRYSLSEQYSEDVVHCDFHSCNVYSPRAFKLLIGVEKDITRDGIVLFE